MYNPVGTRQLSAFTARAMIRVPGLLLTGAWARPDGAPAPHPADHDEAAPPSPLEL